MGNRTHGLEKNTGETKPLSTSLPLSLLHFFFFKEEEYFVLEERDWVGGVETLMLLDPSLIGYSSGNVAGLWENGLVARPSAVGWFPCV